jgi:hypothetical protein
MKPSRSVSKSVEADVDICRGGSEQMRTSRPEFEDGLETYVSREFTTGRFTRLGCLFPLHGTLVNGNRSGDGYFARDDPPNARSGCFFEKSDKKYQHEEHGSSAEAR